AMASAPLSVRPRLQADNGLARERIGAVHVLDGELRLRAWEPDQPPACEVLIAAIDRVGEQALHRVRAHRGEEGLRARPGEVRRLALFQGGDAFVLLRGGDAAERLAVLLGAVRVELRDAAAVEILLIRIGAGERE